MSLDAYLAELKRLIPQAEEELPPGTLEERLGDAIRQFSLVCPYEPAPVDYEGDGSTYNFDLPNGWDSGFSTVRSIEYPVGDQEPELLDHGDYELYRSSTGWQLRFYITPADGKMARVQFTALHRLTDTEDTIHERDKRAFCWLAASLVARNLAAKYAGFTDPSLAADVVAYRTKQKEYSDLADQFERFFKLHFGMGARDLVPAAGNWAKVEFDLLTRQGVELP